MNIRGDHYNLIMNKVALKVLQKIASGEEITKKEISGFLISIIDEKKGEFSAYADFKLNIDFKF